LEFPFISQKSSGADILDLYAFRCKILTGGQTIFVVFFLIISAGQKTNNEPIEPVIARTNAIDRMDVHKCCAISVNAQIEKIGNPNKRFMCENCSKNYVYKTTVLVIYVLN